MNTPAKTVGQKLFKDRLSRTLTTRGWAAVAATFAIIFLSIIGSAIAQVEAPPLPNRNGRIVLTSHPIDRPYDAHIYAMDPDGSNLTNLSGVRPIWSRGDYDPAWSPDGGKIVFTSRRDPEASNYQLYMMNGDGSNQTRLNRLGDRYEVSRTSPTWSPDGKKIAFAGGFSSPTTYTSGICVMDVDGTDELRLTTGYDSAPTWSPDGTRIAFQRHEGSTPPTSQIYVMNADGSNQTRLTNTPLRVNEAPAWSPDGTKIAFDSNRASQGPSTEIYVMNADGSNQVELTKISARACVPIWSPDGTKIVFSRLFNAAHFTVWIMDADGSNQTQLTHNVGTHMCPRDWQRLQDFGEEAPLLEPSGGQVDLSANNELELDSNRDESK